MIIIAPVFKNCKSDFKTFFRNLFFGCTGSSLQHAGFLSLCGWGLLIMVAFLLVELGLEGTWAQ